MTLRLKNTINEQELFKKTSVLKAIFLFVINLPANGIKVKKGFTINKKPSIYIKNRANPLHTKRILHINRPLLLPVKDAER